jgi:hypothetical protein
LSEGQPLITVEVTPDSVAIDIDEAARVVSLAEVPLDLEQIGIFAGARCAAINGEYACHFFAKGGALSLGKPMPWDFFVGEKSIRLVLIFKENVTASVSRIERGPASDAGEGSVREAAEAPSADFDRCRSYSVDPEPAPASVDAPWRDPRPVFQNLPEYPVGDRHHQREWLPIIPMRTAGKARGVKKKNPKNGGNRDRGRGATRPLAAASVGDGARIVRRPARRVAGRSARGVP